MRKWFEDVRAAVDESGKLNAGNQIVVTYQFEKARLEHPEGFTMDRFGRLHKPDTGWCVALSKDSFDSVADAITVLAEWVNQGYQNVYLGYWFDSTDGKDYIDVVMVTSSEELARALGRKFSQVALYDFAAGMAVRLDDEEHN